MFACVSTEKKASRGVMCDSRMLDKGVISEFNPKMINGHVSKKEKELSKNDIPGPSKLVEQINNNYGTGDMNGISVCSGPNRKSNKVGPKKGNMENLFLGTSGLTNAV